MSLALEAKHGPPESETRLAARQLGVAQLWRALVVGVGPEFGRQFDFTAEGDGIKAVIEEHDALIADPELRIVFKWTGEEGPQQEEQILCTKDGFVLTAIAYAAKSGGLAAIWYFGENKHSTK